MFQSNLLDLKSRTYIIRKALFLSAVLRYLFYFIEFLSYRLKLFLLNSMYSIQSRHLQQG